MLKERIAAVEAVTAAFLPTEQAAELTASHGLRCAATMIEQRRAAKLPLDTGATALALIREIAFAALATLDKVHAAHKLLAAVPAEIGLGERGYGDTGCGANVPREAFTTGERHLQSVG